MARIREEFCKRGAALIVVLVIAAAMSVAFAPLAMLALGAVRSAAMSAAGQKALFAAEAGIHRAVREYNATPSYPYWRKRTETWTDVKYTVGVYADFLLIRVDDMISEHKNNMLYVGNFFMGNINDWESISIAGVQLYWSSANTPAFSSSALKEIHLAGSRRYDGGCASGTKISFGPAISFSRMTMYPRKADNAFVFNYDGGLPSDAKMYVIFYFSDNSTRRVPLVPSMNPGISALYNCEFQITSTGEATAPVSAKRTIRAAYDVTSREITSWQEIPNNPL